MVYRGIKLAFLVLCLGGYIHGSEGGRLTRFEIGQDTEKIIKLEVKAGFATLINLPESPRRVSIGNRNDFEVEVGENQIFIHPLLPSSRTNLFITLPAGHVLKFTVTTVEGEFDAEMSFSYPKPQKPERNIEQEIAQKAEELASRIVEKDFARMWVALPEKTAAKEVKSKWQAVSVLGAIRAGRKLYVRYVVENRTKREERPFEIPEARASDRKLPLVGFYPEREKIRPKERVRAVAIFDLEDAAERELQLVLLDPSQKRGELVAKFSVLAEVRGFGSDRVGSDRVLSKDERKPSAINDQIRILEPSEGARLKAGSKVSLRVDAPIRSKPVVFWNGRRLEPEELEEIVYDRRAGRASFTFRGVEVRQGTNSLEVVDGGSRIKRTLSAE